MFEPRTCLKCGATWDVPAAVVRAKSRWRKGGYSMVDAHSAGLKSMSSAYMSYLTDDKNRRDAGRDADMVLLSAFGECPQCKSSRYKSGHLRLKRVEPLG